MVIILYFLGKEPVVSQKKLKDDYHNKATTTNKNVRTFFLSQTTKKLRVQIIFLLFQLTYFLFFLFWRAKQGNKTKDTKKTPQKIPPEHP